MIEGERDLLPEIPEMDAEIWTLVSQIPSGFVSTYGNVARALGDVVASRLVGEVMIRHNHGASCCCHRLVRADGTLGKFVSGDKDEKRLLLEKDGVNVQSNKVSLERFGWTGFVCDSPLHPLLEYQLAVSQAADVHSFVDSKPQTVGGIDVSFVPRCNRGVAAFVEVDLTTREVIYSRTLEAEIQFPYISGYLAYRELPLQQALLDQVASERELPSMIIVDGSGILHWRRSGVATMLGVTLGIRTIGITKKHLVGQVDVSDLVDRGIREILFHDELAGFALLPGSGTKKPIYVSPGHKIDAVSSLAIVQGCLLGRPLPEPIYWADRISRAAANAACDMRTS